MATSMADQATTVGKLFEHIGQLYVALEAMTKECDRLKQEYNEVAKQLLATKAK